MCRSSMLGCSLLPRSGATAKPNSRTTDLVILLIQQVQEFPLETCFVQQSQEID
ncbi:MAG: hypothetical protein WBA93_10200 [Microcoleaceae cyanobacterium]